MKILRASRRYGGRVKQRVQERFQQDPFSAIILYAVLLGLVFLLFAFRGMIAALFIRPLGIVNPSDTTVEERTTNSSGQSSSLDEPIVVRSSGTYTVKSGDTLYSIATALNMSWQDIAELNDIEPPYALTVGQELSLPEDN